MGDLIERATETGALRRVLGEATAGSGGSVVISGPAGIGKTALLGHARDSARAAGFVVLSSRLTPVSTALPHGVVRDWLGSRVRAARPGARPFDGPASPLAEALRDATPTHQAWNLASLDYAVTWVLESLAEAQPLLLLVDDLQWADAGSLQLLDLLSARLPQLPAALLLARRTGERSVAPAVLDRIAGRATRLEPAPLSVAGVEEVRRARPSRGAVAELPPEELHRLTGGVPFMLHELLRAGSLDVAPSGVVGSVRDRLDRLADEAVLVARAVAVLGDHADLDAVADLTDRSVAELAGPLEDLVDAAIVAVDTWSLRPAHPLVAEALGSGMTREDRSALHEAAAGYLRRHGRPTQVVTAHLLHTLPAENPDVVAVLRAAGEESLRSGFPDVAARQLLRAAEETRPEDTDPELVALAASAHLQAGQRAEALHLWTVALERSEEPAQLARMLADMGYVRMTMGERAAAAGAYRRAVTVLTEAGHDSSSPQLRGVLVRMGLARALYEGARSDLVSAVTDAFGQPVERDTHDDRLLFALAAADVSLRATDRHRALELARRAMGGGRLLDEETSDGFGFYVASGVLSWADAYDENRTALEDAMDDARRRGSVLGFATASYCRGLVNYRTGDMRAAIADFQSALELRQRGWSDFATPAVAGAALTHLALGRHDEALALEPTLRAAATKGELVTAQPLATAGVLRAAHGDHEQALADYREAARLMGPTADNASIVDWRELSAWSLFALGRVDEATDLALEAVTLARRWGAPRALGFALRTLARGRERDEALALLREAVALLETSGCGDYLARTRVDLGGLLLTGGPVEREEAVALLRTAADLGRRTGVVSVTTRAGRLLVRAGFPLTPPAERLSGTLTPGERRAAELAAGGATNREIAQKLFVTVKAVEWHLSNAYRKLGISSRRDLPGALYGEGAPSSSSEM